MRSVSKLNLNRSSQDFFWRPSVAYPPMDSVPIHIDAFSPCGNTQSFPIERDSVVATYISLLLGYRRPPTIVRLVISIFVGITVKSRPYWPRSHVFKEALKTMLPTGAHSNAALSVLFVAWAFWIKAAIFGRLPTSIFPAVFPITGMPVLGIVAQTTAALSMTVAQFAAVDHKLSSANTATEPLNLPKPIVGATAQRRQPSECFSSYVNDNAAHNHLRKWLTPFEGARQPTRSIGVRAADPSRLNRLSHFNSLCQDVRHHV